MLHSIIGTQRCLLFHGWGHIAGMNACTRRKCEVKIGCYWEIVDKLCREMFSFRHILSSLHFNENVKRESKMTKQGEPYVKVS